MSGGSQKFNMKTVLVNGGEDVLANSNNGGVGNSHDHVITSLKKFTEYEVSNLPAYRYFDFPYDNTRVYVYRSIAM